MDSVDVISTTVRGVLDAKDPGGTVHVELPEGANVTSLTVIDGEGNTAQVFLDYVQAARIMSALGASMLHM
jgi:hypothetical protein